MLGALAVRTVHTTIVGAGAPVLEDDCRIVWLTAVVTLLTAVVTLATIYNVFWSR